MDYELAIKMIGAIAVFVATAVGIGKFAYDILIGHVSHKRESYKFAKDFFDYVQQSKEINPYVLEKGFKTIAGNARLNMEEIKYLISLKNGDNALRDYILGKQYLEYKSEMENFKIVFKGNFSTKWARKWGVKTYGILYFSLCIIGVAPLFISSIFPTNMAYKFPISIGFLVYFIFFAYMPLKAGSRIYRAKNLVEHQEKHFSDSLPKIS